MYPQELWTEKNQKKKKRVKLLKIRFVIEKIKL